MRGYSEKGTLLTIKVPCKAHTTLYMNAVTVVLWGVVVNLLETFKNPRDNFNNLSQRFLKQVTGGMSLGGHVCWWERCKVK